MHAQIGLNRRRALHGHRITHPIRVHYIAETASKKEGKSGVISMEDFLVSHRGKGLHWTKHKTSANMQP